MFKKFSLIIMISILLLSSFYAIQLVSSPEAQPDLVSAATAAIPSAPTPAPIPAPAPVPVPTPVPIVWSNSPSSWAKVELQLAEENGLTIKDLMNQYNKPITRIEFIRLVVHLHQVEKGALITPSVLYPFKDSTSLDVAKAYSLGLINGVSSTVFNPNGLLTRQESAVILYREWIKLHPAYKTPTVEMAFADSSSLSAWAKEAAQFMVSNELLKGNGNNQLDPKGNTTKEQAFVLMLRSFQKSASMETPDAVSSATGGSSSSAEQDDEEED